MSDNWYSTGFESAKAEEQRRASAMMSRRFWMPKGSKKSVVFVDDDPFTIYEHQYQRDGNWKNWVTCSRGIYDEAVCCAKLGEKSRRWVGYFTVVDLSEWKDNKGNIRKNELVFFAAPLNVLKILESRKADNGGTLVGAMITIQRIGDSGAAVGNDFVVQKVGDLDKLAPEVAWRGKKLKDIINLANNDPAEAKSYMQRFQVEPDSDGQLALELNPFNYMELLKPKNQKDMKQILSGLQVQDDEKGGDDQKDDDDVPF